MSRLASSSEEIKYANSFFSAEFNAIGDPLSGPITDMVFSYPTPSGLMGISDDGTNIKWVVMPGKTLSVHFVMEAGQQLYFYPITGPDEVDTFGLYISCIRN